MLYNYGQNNLITTTILENHPWYCSNPQSPYSYRM
jgi:hypothetical protein